MHLVLPSEHMRAAHTRAVYTRAAHTRAASAVRRRRGVFPPLGETGAVPSGAGSACWDRGHCRRVTHGRPPGAWAPQASETQTSWPEGGDHSAVPSRLTSGLSGSGVSTLRRWECALVIGGGATWLALA